MGKTIVLLGTLDTKGVEFGYIVEQIRTKGYKTIVIDVGMLGEPLIQPDIGHDQVAEAAGAKIEEITRLGQEEALEVMTKGAIRVVRELYHSRRLDGIIALGGSMGTSLAGAAMQALPVGVPKVVMSTMASGDISCYVGIRDITMISSVADIAGLNRVTKRLLTTAAGAIMGMVAIDPGLSAADKPLIGVSLRGDKLPCFNMVKAILEAKGCEVVAFHAVGSGGKALEEWVEEGLLDAVFDLCPVEVTEHLFGGRFSAGPQRLEAAARRGIPQLVGPGSIHVVNFSGEGAIPQRLKERKRLMHSPSIAIVWLNSQETASVGRVVAEKLNKAVGPTAVIIPKRGFAVTGWEEDREAEAAFTQALKGNLKPGIEFVEVDANINDRIFAERAAALLLELLERSRIPRKHRNVSAESA